MDQTEKLFSQTTKLLDKTEKMFPNTEKPFSKTEKLIFNTEKYFAQTRNCDKQYWLTNLDAWKIVYELFETHLMKIQITILFINEKRNGNTN